MSNILHIHAKEIHSLTDLYTMVEIFIWQRAHLYSHNLDALQEVLSEIWLKEIVIHERQKLKEILDRDHEEDGEMSPYYRLLDLLIDLEGVDILLED